MKILFVCRSFSGMAGGVERMSIAIMNAMCRRGHEVHLITWDHPQAPGAFFTMEPTIVWHKIGIGDHQKKAGFITRIKRWIKFWSLVHRIKPDVGIGFQHGPFVAAKVYTLGLGVPMICAERNALDRMKYNDRIEKKWLTFQTMRLAAAVTIQCPSYLQTYPSFLWDRMVTIPNPVFPAQSFAMPKGNLGERKILLAVGRLAYQKNFQCLVRAFAQLKGSFVDWDLHIIGNGEHEEEIRNLVATLGIQDRVMMPGALPPTEFQNAYASAHLFCLPSRWEGFPNVLAEAMAHGLPVVGFAECPGVRDLIENGRNGLLVPGIDDADCLAKTLSLLMGDDRERDRLGRTAIDSVTLYEPEKIFQNWEDLFYRLSKRKSS